MKQRYQEVYNVCNKKTERSFKLVLKGTIYENKESKISFRSSANTFMAACFLVVFARRVFQFVWIGVGDRNALMFM
jgi:hypothetical protein